MKILIINYYFSPTIDAHAYRWAEIAKFWALNGHDVHVITSRIRGLKNITNECGVSVKRVGLIAKSQSSTAIIIRKKSLVSKVRSKFLSVLRWIYRKLYWPDVMWHWFPSVLWEVWRRRHETYDLVISYYPCMASHGAAAIMKRWDKNEYCKWIADYGDPFSTSVTMPPNNFLFYDTLNKIIETKIASHVNYMTFTNEPMAADYKIKLRQEMKITVVPHLVNVDTYYSSEKRKADFFTTTITFVGGFHRNIREPGRLIQLLKQLNRLDRGKYRLNIYGPLNGFNISELAPTDCPEIQYMGSVPREVATELIRNAEILINVDNENCAMTPSKLVEYIGTGLPIINITDVHTFYSPLQRYIDLGYAISVVEKDISEISAEEVMNFIKKHKAKTSATLQEVNNVLEDHRLETVANRYLSLAGL